MGVEGAPVGGRDVVDNEAKVKISNFTDAAGEGVGEDRPAIGGVDSAERFGTVGVEGDDSLGGGARGAVEEKSEERCREVREIAT